MPFWGGRWRWIWWRSPAQWDNITLSGYTTRPTATRGNRNSQHFFVNGRYVRSRLLAAALEQAYQNQLAASRFPGCVLHLHLPLQSGGRQRPSGQDGGASSWPSRSVFDAVYYGVLSALNRTPGRPEVQLPAQQAAPAPAAPADVRTGRKSPPRLRSRCSAPPTARQPGFFRTMTAGEYQAMSRALEERPPVPASPSFQRQVLPSGGTRLASPPPELLSDQSPVPLWCRAPPGRRRPHPLPFPRRNRRRNRQPAPEPVQQEMSLPAAQTWRLVGEVLQTYLVIEHAGRDASHRQACRPRAHPLRDASGRSRPP